MGWKIKAIDNAGNERSEGRTLIVDLTGPTLSSLSSSDSAGSKDDYSLVTNQKPNLTGTITDNYSPDKVKVSIYKENYFLGAITSKEPSTSLTYSLSNGSNNKSLSFSIPVPDSLDFGSYEVNIKGSDKAGNISTTSTIYLKVMTRRQAQEFLQGKIAEKDKETIQEKSQVSLPRLEEKAKERREREAQELEKAMSPIAEDFRTVASVVLEGTEQLIGSITTIAEDAIAFGSSMTGEGIKIASSTIGNGLLKVTNGFSGISQVLEQSSQNVQSEIAKAYKSMPPMVSLSQILRPAADFALVVREEVGRRLEDGGQMLAQINHNSFTAFNSINTTSEANVKKAINSYYSEASTTLRRGISSIAFGVGEKADIFSNRISVAVVNFGYVFATEPTRIYDVSVLTLSPTSAKVSWRTNHPANGKVNWGLDKTYPEDIQTSKRTTYHEFTLTNLTPNTEYHFEVMSQNKNYVYDANREFKTPGR